MPDQIAAQTARSSSPTGPRASKRFLLSALASAGLALGLGLGTPAFGQTSAAPAEDKEAVQNSRMDSTLFYQLLVGEVQARSGDFGSAYQIYLELARRHKNPELFKRAIEIALQARAGEEALTAAKAWRQALPQSREAAEYVSQIAIALGRTTDLAEPLKSLIQQSPAPQQPRLIASLPRSLSRLTDRKAAARIVDEVTDAWRNKTPELAEAWIASGEGWLGAGDKDKAMAALQRALKANPAYIGNGLLAINLMDAKPDAEDIARAQLARPAPPSALRLTYARKLAASQRMAEAAEQLDQLVKASPDDPAAWLTLGAVRMELKQYDKAEGALTRFLDLRHAATASPSDDETEDAPHQADATVDQAYLLLAQLEEQRAQFQKALDWLDKVNDQSDSLLLQTQKARLLAKMGKLDEARKVIQSLPEDEPRDAAVKFQAEAQLLRDANRVGEAYKVMEQATTRFPDDPDLLYEQAMLGERLHRFDDMEKLLRKAMTLAPDNPHNYNALGYSLADRNIRLDEARELITKALSIKPGDPFITDSMGWLEFRSGHLDEALKLLRAAYAARPDPEIAAHLGEVLWSQGQQDEARTVWRQARERDSANEALKDTLKRLRVRL
ncbi:tetratricopeptide repeat protein [Aquabacterium sp.]|uniref:tetratricopeptide repeat protein n=1 Tax=Aquabacterium sp. TaxID=1872578 RepID=UPI0035B15579